MVWFPFIWTIHPWVHLKLNNLSYYTIYNILRALVRQRYFDLTFPVTKSEFEYECTNNINQRGKIHIIYMS